MEILVLPKRKFLSLMKGESLFDGNIEKRENLYIISIDHASFDPDEGDVEHVPYFKLDHPNVLRLFFDDVMEDMVFGDKTITKAMNVEQAREVVGFVDIIRPNATLIVSCMQGESMSVAIADFVTKRLGLDPRRVVCYGNERRPNKKVTELLNQVTL